MFTGLISLTLATASLAGFQTEVSNSDSNEDQLYYFIEKNLPLADRMNYDESFFRRNIRSSLRAKEEMPWGKSVPEREFRHFVVPIRVNNENLDNSREIFYEELRERVCSLSMEDAILEVNHWAHEKVTYQPSDARTSSPLSSVSQAIGRCGEESTLLVAALRSVGIPARQVYTPRWAHTDDNHAWVEAWANGKWYFLGACEPEPVLNLAWFNAPASRGMMMHTNVFGDYDGPEEVIERKAISTVINVTANYAPVAETIVRIVNTDGKPVENADVSFCLYNYAEFFPLAKKKTDYNGYTSLTTGLGDMVIWATDGCRFAIRKVNPSESPVDIKLDLDADSDGVIDFNIVPPRQSADLPHPADCQIEANERRKSYEDSLRMGYVSTFADSASAAAAAVSLGLDCDRLSKVLLESRGNHRILIKTLLSLTPDKRETALMLLEAVSEKDRRDITPDVIVDAVEYAVGHDSPFFKEYILNPRIESEWIYPWRKSLSDAYDDNLKKRMRNDPSLIVKEILRTVKIDSVGNPSRLRINPAEICRLGVSDLHNRNLYFVALARTCGLPARIDPITGKTQYVSSGGNWIDVDFNKNRHVSSVSPSGTVMFSDVHSGNVSEPGYYYNFSISRIDNGDKRLLEYDDNATIHTFMADDGCSLDVGQYILTTGQRLANGGVLVHSEIFHVKEDRQTPLVFEMRQDDSELQVCGSLNAENIYHDIDKDTDKSLLSTTGRGYYILMFMRPNHEPSEHTLNEISALASEFEKDGRKIMLVFRNAEEAGRYDSTRFSLPSNVVAGYDIEGTIAEEISKVPGVSDGEYPVILVADTFNRVVFVSSGYTIGLGRRLIDTMKRLDQ